MSLTYKWGWGDSWKPWATWGWAGAGATNEGFVPGAICLESISKSVVFKLEGIKASETGLSPARFHGTSYLSRAVEEIPVNLVAIHEKARSCAPGTSIPGFLRSDGLVTLVREDRIVKNVSSPEADKGEVTEQTSKCVRR